MYVIGFVDGTNDKGEDILECAGDLSDEKLVELVESRETLASIISALDVRPECRRSGCSSGEGHPFIRQLT